MSEPKASPEQLEKYQKLLSLLRGYGSVAIAFSGGVDSTLLLYAAHEALPGSCIAVTASSRSFPERERNEALEFCRNLSIPHFLYESHEMQIPGFAENPPDRCYLCKKEIFSGLLSIAREQGMAELAEGSNVDDLGDYRPGLLAIRELGVKSPLREAGLFKSDIRALLHHLGLPIWEKPSFACLASRFPYGEEITAEKLAMVEGAEDVLRSLGFVQYRVRIHGRIARIELLPKDIPRLMEEKARQDVATRLKGLGFSYVTLDLQGYRTGSLNEVLSQEQLDAAKV